MIIPPDLLGAVLDMLADRLAARIATVAERNTYDSRNLPPRCARRRFAEVCRSGRVQGARREGRDWTCSREAWEAARRRAPPRVVTVEARPTSLDAQADRLLERAGLRVVGGASQ